jgi:DNA-directed RNA polymerase specialized sigma subunit
MNFKTYYDIKSNLDYLKYFDKKVEKIAKRSQFHINLLDDYKSITNVMEEKKNIIKQFKELDDKIKSVDPIMQKVLELKFKEDMSIEQISRLYNISLRTLFRKFELLAKQLKIKYKEGA